MKISKLLSKLGPFSWTLHNLIAHPLSELVYLLGLGSAPFDRASNWIHDVTVPEHDAGTGRG
jgi:hypothetical protein